jgi:hypothetical protein
VRQFKSAFYPDQISVLSRPTFNKTLREHFVAKGWTDQPHVFGDEEELGAKMDFLKERVGIEVGFGHVSFIGIDLLKFQVSSYFSTRSNRCGHLRSYNEKIPETLRFSQSKLGREPHI